MGKVRVAKSAKCSTPWITQTVSKTISRPRSSIGKCSQDQEQSPTPLSQSSQSSDVSGMTEKVIRQTPMSPSTSISRKNLNSLPERKKGPPSASAKRYSDSVTQTQTSRKTGKSGYPDRKKMTPSASAKRNPKGVTKTLFSPTPSAKSNESESEPEEGEIWDVEETLQTRRSSNSQDSHDAPEIELVMSMDSDPPPHEEDHLAKKITKLQLLLQEKDNKLKALKLHMTSIAEQEKAFHKELRQMIENEKGKLEKERGRSTLLKTMLEKKCYDFELQSKNFETLKTNFEEKSKAYQALEGELQEKSKEYDLLKSSLTDEHRNGDIELLNFRHEWELKELQNKLLWQQQTSSIEASRRENELKCEYELELNTLKERYEGCQLIMIGQRKELDEAKSRMAKMEGEIWILETDNEELKVELDQSKASLIGVDKLVKEVGQFNEACKGIIEKQQQDRMEAPKWPIYTLSDTSF